MTHLINRPMEVPSRNALYNMYYDLGMTLTEIAEEYEVNMITVSKWLKKRDIKPKKMKNYYNIPSKDEIYQKYIIENMTRKELSEFYGVGSTTITRYLKNYRIFKNKNC